MEDSATVVETVPLVMASQSPGVALPSSNCTLPAAVAGGRIAVSVSLVFASAGEVGVTSGVVVVVVASAACPVVTSTDLGSAAALATPPVSKAAAAAAAATKVPDANRVKNPFLCTI